MEKLKKEFIGEPYETEKDKEHILKKYDIYEINKLEYLNSMYDNISSLSTIWSIYRSFVHPIEKIKQKDLMHFSSEEIEGIVATLISYSEDMKRGLMSFIVQYCKYCYSKGLIVINPTDTINKREIVKANKKAQHKKFMNLDEVYDIVSYAYAKGKLKYALPMLLARYGINGEELLWMRNLKFSHIDFENKVVNIFDVETGELIIKIPVDDRFLFWMKKARDEQEKDKKYSEYVFYSKRDDKMMTKDGIHTRNNYLTTIIKEKDKFFIRLSFQDLFKSREFELLLKIRAKRKINIMDCEIVSEALKGETTKEITLRLKKLWINLTNDKLISLKSSSYELIDNNSEVFANEIAKNLRINLKEIPMLIKE